MKKIHIVLLVLIAGAIAVLISFLNTSATYESIAGARANPGKFVHVAAALDKSYPVEYDEHKDANFLSFTAVDSLGDRMKVVYRDGRIPNLETAVRLVLEGRFQENYFECKRVQTQCPSKYNDDMKSKGKDVQNMSQQVPAENNAEQAKSEK